jgi:ribosome-associated protein
MKEKTKLTKSPSAKVIVDCIIKGIEEKKGKNIQIFDLRKIKHAVSEYFVICNADSKTQVDAIAYSVEHEVKQGTGESPWHGEGYGNAEWILIDYANVVVHVFQTQVRDFYKLENLWADAKITVLESSNL